MPQDGLPGWTLLERTLWKDGEPFQGLSYTQRLADGKEGIAVFIRLGKKARIACVNAERTASYAQHAEVTDVMSEAELEELIRLFKTLPDTPQDIEIRLL